MTWKRLYISAQRLNAKFTSGVTNSCKARYFEVAREALFVVVASVYSNSISMIEVQRVVKSPLVFVKILLRHTRFN